MPTFPRLHWPALSPEATLPKSGFPVCADGDSSAGIIQRAIFQLDGLLRRWQGIFEFCEADDCLLRVAISRAKVRIDLPDGSAVHPGDQVIEIHWWNEHVARLVSDKPALARAKLLPALVRHSFEQLAKYLLTAPEAKHARFIHGNAMLPTRSGREAIGARIRQYGFWAVHAETGFLVSVHDHFEKYLVWALLWAFHRHKVALKNHRLQRVDLWASRSEFLDRYQPSLAPSISARDTFDHFS